VAIPIPKFSYNPGTGTVNFIPTYANVQKPYLDDFEALRHDSISSSGIRQSMVERVDRVKPINFESVPWSDLPAWNSFLSYALLGGDFSYYPDSTATTFATWQIVDDKVSPQFVAIGLSKITFHMRQVPGGASAP
jgi:hypothetical protein